MDTAHEVLDGIAIVGMSGRFPGAKDVDQFWKNLINGVDCISRFREDELEFSVLTPEVKARGKKSVAARGILQDVDLFDAEFFGIYPREAEIMDPQHRIFLECAWESLEAAGYNPYAYPGMVGVFAGVSLNTYLLFNLSSDGKFASNLAGNYQVGQYQAMLGNDKDFLPTRVSYKLNLKGPSMAIQTACSSSLVAVSQACTSLFNYQCDMALAGGVSITFPQRRDYLFEEEGLASVDGTCRTFDADAKGTVFGHGCAVLLLKRLQDAIQDHDPILAVIRGTAINNDGSEKIGYAAPSVNAQAEVIAMAQAAADVDPNTISYIEAHGTGTPLGDPIEIAALTKAFREAGAEGNGFCAIGSGKPNISHLDVASGATGLIKTVMQLKHGKLPPLLHFNRPNPNIDFANSPFYPVTQLQEWNPNGNPRRAGVSAFGVGGTNAHVIVEEAPARQSKPNSDSAHIIPLSARSETALKKMRANLAARLRDDASLALEDVAYTLQIGRKSFGYRTALVASSREQLLSQLDEELKSNAIVKAPENGRKVVFLFPGQGAQYVDMGRDLYHREPVFRREVDLCATILSQHLGQDVRSVLYPSSDAERSEAERLINETWITQPAIFVAEYALAKLWISWGIQPDVLIGHSIGEYVCAVLAGTFTLDEALGLLSVRARLMQNLPAGSMLGVRLGAAEVEPLLPSGVSIAAMNSPKLCTVSGATDILEQFQKELDSKNVASKLLATSHAFHSQMMEPMLAEFTAVCEHTNRKSPHVRWISTCTGKDMTADDLSDPAYWSRQLRYAVRFADALDTIAADESDCVFLEVGPGRALAQFVRQHPANIRPERIITSLVPSENGQSDYESTYAALGKSWTAGLCPDWDALHGEHKPYRVTLPTYPFERKRYWVEPNLSALKTSDQSATNIGADESCATSIAESESGCATGDCFDVAVQTAIVETHQTNVPTASPRELITAELHAILLNLSGMTIEDDDASFIDLGFDSLFLSQASQAIDARFGIKITFRQLLGDLCSVSAIATHLEGIVPAEVFTPVAAPAPVAATAGSAAASTMTVSQSVNLNLSGSVDVQRMLDNHVKSIQQLIDQGRRQQASEGRLRTVYKPSGSSAADASHAGEAPKRFGPYKPIEKGEKGGLTERQESALNNLIERYIARTSKSKAYTAEHRPHFADPRAVAGFRSQWKEIVYPIVSARSKGSRIWDIDGNEYVDITMGFGTYFFGHSPDWLISALEKQLHIGLEIGPQSAMAGKVAKTIAEMTGLERVTFCNTGSEAVMAAMRLARTVTGRNRIVYFTGDYHGMFEEVLVRGAWPNGEYRAQPIAPGIPPSLVENMLVLDYGSPESLEIIRTHGDEIAAVMVEPVQSRNPSHQPREFLHQIRAITKDIGAALIFDEVVTGFRCHQGGAQAYFGIEADMATYGKVVGGGIPIGILAGSSKFMDALDGGQWQYGDDSFPEVGVTFFAGTFVRHPLAIAAADAVLTFLQEAGPDLQAKMSERVTRVCNSVNEAMERAQVPIRMSSFSAFAAIDYAHDLKFGSLLWYYMREKGIHIWEGRPCYFTIAHTDEDLQLFIDAFTHSVEEMQRDGFLPEPSADLHIVEGWREEQDRFPLAEGQREMWLGAQMSPTASGPHHACNAFRIEGELNVDYMRQALDRVVGRHEGLRSSFNEDGTQVVVQQNLKVELPLIDLRDLSETERETRVREIMEEEGKRLFPLSGGPLISAQILRLSDNLHQMIFTAQMIVCDGWSHYVLFEELSEIYSALCENRSPNLRDAVPMRTYAKWQRDYWQSEEYKRCEQYWLNQYKTVPSPLDLPTKGLRPLSRTVTASRCDLLLSSDFYDSVKQYGRNQKSSSFAVLLAAFQVWLHRLSGARDLVVGVPFAEQNSLGLDTLVGQCANTLPIRAQIEPQETFTGLLSRTWDSLLDAQENVHFTFGRLIQQLNMRHDPSRIPLVSVIFNIDPAMTKVKFSGLKHHFFAAPRFYYQFDLGFNLVEEADGLRVECDFNTNLFDEACIEDWLRGYETLLTSIIQGDDTPITSLPLVSETESTSQPPTGLSVDSTILSILKDRATSSPEAIALQDQSGEYSFETLANMSRAIAWKLSDQGVVQGDRVGVIARRGIDAVAGILGAMQCGAVAIPVDAALSVQLKNRILAEAKPKAALVQEELIDDCIDCPCAVIRLTSDAGSVPSDFPTQIDFQDTDIALELYEEPQVNGPLHATRLSHSAISLTALAGVRRLNLGPADRLLALSPTNGCAGLMELLLALASGARYCASHVAASTDPLRLANDLSTQRITLLFATPTQLTGLAESGWQGDKQLKVVIHSERFSNPLVEMLQPLCAQTWWAYGSTGAAGWVSYERLMSNQRVALSGAIEGVSLKVVDDHSLPVPRGVPGHLLIERATFGSAVRTGDRFVRKANGTLEQVGTKDSLVMLDERDIELSQLEDALRECEGVQSSAVVLRDDVGDGVGLVAYVFMTRQALESADHRALVRKFRQTLRSKFPSYMLPCRFVATTEMPMTADGKLDRGNLVLPPENEGDSEDDYFAPSSLTEEKLVAIWQDVLKLPKVGVDDNFFELGGQSLLAVKVFARIENDLGRKLPLAMLFQAPTISQLAAIMDNQDSTGSSGWRSLIPIQSSGTQKPLFLVHGAGGNVLLYHALSQRLAPNYPLYGLQSQGLDGVSAPLHTIEEMATHYLKEIRAVQPHGPYYLGGYCLGGTVAYEMAQQLSQIGEEVALVAMLDTYNFSRALKSSMIGFLIQKLRFHLGNFVGLRPRHMLAYLKEKYRVARDGEFANLFTSRPGFDVDENAGRATSGAELQVQGINDTAAETYLPKPYAGELTLFKPRINYKFYPDPKMGWGDLALGGLDIVEFPFNPHAMLVEPYVEQLANALIERMHRASRRTSSLAASDQHDSKREVEVGGLVLR